MIDGCRALYTTNIERITNHYLRFPYVLLASELSFSNAALSADTDMLHLHSAKPRCGSSSFASVHPRCKGLPACFQPRRRLSPCRPCVLRLSALGALEEPWVTRSL